MIAGHAIVHLIYPLETWRQGGIGGLSRDEQARAARFHFEKDARHWIACRLALRSILAEALTIPPLEVPLVTGEFGKPELAAPFQHLHFNLSHCPDLAIVALCGDGPVGVDLESLARAADLPGCEESFCHPAEIRALPVAADARATELLRIWTAKEAVLKAIGTGMSVPPETVRVSPDGVGWRAVADGSLPDLEHQRIHRLVAPGLSAHLAMLSAPESVHRIDVFHDPKSVAHVHKQPETPPTL